eukprot:TRINITY_DN107942_c0_g1_i1.p1 TRINITY_DN107942_c0_g1~~TRINITY_DN107942_c0_g1_i1.p1  ORF type:complete len:471 (+),score=90.99 TRINITY_DN107942_c0_g1_i1:52-1413(+)
MAALWKVTLSLCVGSVQAWDQHVLFLGNSFSFFNGGVWRQYKTIAEHCIPGLRVWYSHSASGAETLSMHSHNTQERGMVEADPFDILVLQDQSGLNEADQGYEAVKNWFIPQARKKKAMIGFFETWSTPRMGGNFSANTEWLKSYYEANAAFAREAGVKVTIARAGEAYREVLEDKFGGDFTDPGFQSMYFYDHQHPSYLGHNLAAWTMVLAYNKDYFMNEGKGCDASRVPNVQNQDTDWKFMFAEIACELAGVCEKKKRTSDTKLNDLAKRMQGEWVRRKELPDCDGSHCNFLEKWTVDGTTVTQKGLVGNWSTVDGHNTVHMVPEIKSYKLHILGEDVKIVPKNVMVKTVTSTKMWLGDCTVVTRPSDKDAASLEECWCLDDGWRDNQGNDCKFYMGKILNDGFSPFTACFRSPRLSDGATASVACPICNKCLPRPESDGQVERKLGSFHV